MVNDGERIARLEERQRNIDEKMDTVARQVNEMHDLLLQAKGAKWAILGVASMAGFLSAKAGTVAAMIGIKLP